MLSVEDVSLRFGHQHVLNRLSLRLHRGELLAMLGGNAAGKTSLLRVIAGLESPQEGRVCLQNDDITDLRPDARLKRGLAFCQAERQLFPEMSVEENLTVGAYCMSNYDNIAQSLAQVHDLFPILAKRAGQRAGSLSGGEQKMVALGRAVMSQPELLLLDEPSLGLSPAMRETMASAIQALHEEGLTVLMTEQDVTLAGRLAERLVMLERGRVIDDE